MKRAMLRSETLVAIIKVSTTTHNVQDLVCGIHASSFVPRMDNSLWIQRLWVLLDATTWLASTVTPLPQGS